MLAYWLERSSQVYGDTVAIAHGLQPYMTYRDLGERAARFAAGLISEGEAKAGDRIAIFASNCPEYLEILFGIWHAGMVAVPINGKLHPREVNDILEDSAARLCLISDDLTRKWQIGHPAGCSFVTIGTSQYEDFFAATPLLRQEVKGHDLAWLFYTSGTTGKPKGAMLSYDNLVAMCHGYVTDVNEIKQGHSIIHAAPMSHGSGLYALPHIAAGA
ncbi:MAG: AMP-binding protein, partial [Alphaproteobacteria bacterium]|nr:AMP-binding protein [Alphaproteobacteria bacterium]